MGGSVLVATPDSVHSRLRLRHRLRLKLGEGGVSSRLRLGLRLRLEGGEVGLDITTLNIDLDLCLGSVLTDVDLTD